MSKVASGHPGEEQLLRYADGELSPRESAGVRTHLEACWECRAELDQLQAAVTDCVHYRKSVLQAHLPPPPMPWRDLSAGFAAADRQIAGEKGWWRSLRDALAAPRFWAPALAAGLALVFIVLPWLRETPTVQAAELLRKAAAAADVAAAAAPRGQPIRKLSVRTRTRRLAYAAGSAELKPVAQMFAAARYDWADPLSAKSFLAWHDQLAAKTDQVLTEAGDFYRVRTVSGSGEISEATLRLRQDNLRPVEGTFKFRNGEWVEVTEVAETSLVSSAAAAAEAPSRTRTPQGAPLTTTPAAGTAEATLSDELRVFAALHKIGADLGEPIEVSRAGAGGITVKAFGLDARRQSQVASALAGIPALNLEFASEGGSGAGLGSFPDRAAVVRGGDRDLQAQLEAQLGSPAAVEQLANEAFDRNESVMERAHAIRRLAARFPAPDALQAEDRALLRSMLREHAQQLARHRQELASLLKRVLPAQGAASVSAAQPAPTAELLFLAARRLEVSLSMMLSSGRSGDPLSLPQRIVGQLAELEQLTRNYSETMGQ